jgi:hypothetical protein
LFQITEYRVTHLTTGTCAHKPSTSTETTSTETTSTETETTATPPAPVRRFSLSIPGSSQNLHFGQFWSIFILQDMSETVFLVLNFVILVLNPI